ncbi:hypothetical protein BJ508DRAFT_380460 [Ascobolus immersus RN42]|uniref:Uncharacterized protein n=1 Tax=Ascobolus immersus RN42 TaxID=1160509 RepID=A0A3N4HQA1_ASCIM|nr:hypothetical protein BJ508DRAFT_380460 [Ascobolus immersus RN42]
MATVTVSFPFEKEPLIKSSFRKRFLPNEAVPFHRCALPDGSPQPASFLLFTHTAVPLFTNTILHTNILPLLCTKQPIPKPFTSKMASGNSLSVPDVAQGSRASTTESDLNIDPTLRALQAATLNQTSNATTDGHKSSDEEMTGNAASTLASGSALPTQDVTNINRASTTESDKNIDPTLRALQAATLNQTLNANDEGQKSSDEEMAEANTTDEEVKEETTTDEEGNDGRKSDEDMAEGSPDHNSRNKGRSHQDHPHRDVLQQELKEESSDGDCGLRSSTSSGAMDTKPQESDDDTNLGESAPLPTPCHAAYFVTRWKDDQVCDLCKSAIPMLDLYALCVRTRCCYKECKICFTRRMTLASATLEDAERYIQDAALDRHIPSDYATWVHDWYPKN